MAYETQCGGCTSFDFQGDNVKGYCSYYKCYYYPGDSCSHQTPRESSSGCYITTVVCDVLGFSDDCYVLNELRNFRDNVMQQNSEYSNLLLEYDSIGPDIAFFIDREYRETKDKEMWIQVYNFYLCAVANFVKENKYLEAIERYKEMVNSLKEYFGILEDYKQKVENYDYKQGGHGKIKTFS